jgi:hypothetical protein
MRKKMPPAPSSTTIRRRAGCGLVSQVPQPGRAAAVEATTAGRPCRSPWLQQSNPAVVPSGEATTAGRLCCCSSPPAPAAIASELAIPGTELQQRGSAAGPAACARPPDAVARATGLGLGQQAMHTCGFRDAGASGSSRSRLSRRPSAPDRCGRPGLGPETATERRTSSAQDDREPAWRGTASPVPSRRLDIALPAGLSGRGGCGPVGAGEVVHDGVQAGVDLLAGGVLVVPGHDLAGSLFEGDHGLVAGDDAA